MEFLPPVNHLISLINKEPAFTRNALGCLERKLGAEASEQCAVPREYRGSAPRSASRQGFVCMSMLSGQGRKLGWGHHVVLTHGVCRAGEWRPGRQVRRMAAPVRSHAGCRCYMCVSTATNHRDSVGIRLMSFACPHPHKR